HYDEAAGMLKDSFRSAGFSGPVLVLSEEASLPDDVCSLYRMYCHDETACAFCGAVHVPAEKSEAEIQAYRLRHAGWLPGMSRYFNQIELPDYWEISADGMSARVYDRNHLRGRIFYAKTEKSRIVSDADWLDEAGTVRFTDHYDLHGLLYARTTFNEKGERFCCSWMDEEGRERVVENYVTGDILVNRNGTTELFRSRTELAVSLIRELGYEGRRIFYNSLSTPLFVSEQLDSCEEGNVLFWQEGPRPDIPGNMQMILEGNSHTREILAQNRESCRKLLSLGASSGYVKPFGFLYGFDHAPRNRNEVLICTNSDQIASLEELVKGLPEMNFRIAAVTEMSSKLLAFGSCPNVRLYPAASRQILNQLFAECGWYFDINYGNEIVSAVKRAFLNEMLIMGFRFTLHRPQYAAEEHVFADAEGLIAEVKKLMASESMQEEHLSLQKQAAMSEPVSSYQHLFQNH
ncbi:MAG: accessory Sec system glycosylation chaperone GtfB, partial [Bulleidia sp.]